MDIISHSSHCSPSLFTKGMTLSDYMTALPCQDRSNSLPSEQDKQQNLFPFGVDNLCGGLSKGRERFSIREVDEESAEESAEGTGDDLGQKYEQEQLTKETFRQSNFFLEHLPPKPQHSMNATAYFNHSHQKQSFRVKHHSNSPFKKKVQNSPHIQAAPITLYGRKFAHSIAKDTKVPQLATFYGKMKERTEGKERTQVKQKTQGKQLVESRLKQKGKIFKKKGQLELDQLIKFQQKIKSNYSQKIYFQDIRIEGIRDKICERKNKLY